MYNALFALLLAAGVAIAWRSNPLYSLGRTVRFLAVCTLAVAAVVGAFIAVIHATDGRPAIEGGIALGITIFAGTMLLIWVIVTVSTPPPPALIPGTKLVFINRRYVIPWLKRLLFAFAFFVAIVVLLRGDLRDVVLVVGSMFGYLAAILIFTFYIAALGMDRSLTSVESAPWIHWTYPPATWAAWRDVLVARTAVQPRSWIWSRDWKKFVAPFVITVAASLTLQYASVPLSWSVPFYAIVGIVMVGMIELAARFEAHAPERLRRLLLKAPPETYAGEAGIFCDGTYSQWLTPAAYLVSARIDERPPRSIMLQFAQIVAGAIEPRAVTQSVLIPPGADDDIRRLQQHLAASVPSATVELTP